MTGASIIGFSAGLAFLLIETAATRSYWAGGQQIQLNEDSMRLVLKFDSGVLPDSQQTILSAVQRITSQVEDDHAFDGFIVCSLSTGSGYYTFLDSLQSVGGVNLVEPYYRDSFDSPMLASSRFCVGFDDDLTRSQVDSINALYNVVVDHQLQYLPHVYVLRNTDSSGRRVLDLANLYYDMPEVQFSHPEFGVWVRKDSYHLFDHYNDHQWQVKKVIGQFDTASVWDFGGLYSDTIQVAVIDDGVASHEDLDSSRVLPGYDFADYDNNASPGAVTALNDHGMCVAGIIGAAHCTDSLSGLLSTSGIVGINPTCKIRPVKIFHDNGRSDFVLASDVANAIVYADTMGADIISCSWSWIPFDEITLAIYQASHFGGRYNQGALIVFSAGNNYDTLLSYPANLVYSYDDWILAVSAVDSSDYLWNYSNRRGEDLVAPSADVCLRGDFWSLDQMGNNGANPDPRDMVCGGLVDINWNCDNPNNPNYDCRFGGTSAACPVVSGIASLVFSYDTTLRTWQVDSILRTSAVKTVGGKIITNPPDPDYGYGRVDAFRAILSIARGNIDNDSAKVIDIADISTLIDHLYISFTPLFPNDLIGDVDCTGRVDIGDLTALLDYLFLSFTHIEGTPSHPCFEYGP